MNLCCEVLAAPPGMPDDFALVCEQPEGHFPLTAHKASNGWRWA